MTRSRTLTKNRPEPWEKIAVFAFGVLFVVALLVLAIKYPHPTPFQYEVFKVVLALAVAGVASLIPGFLSVRISKFVRAGGALAVFAVTYFFSPASLVVETTLEPEPSSLDLGLGVDAAKLTLVARGPEDVVWKVASHPPGFSVVPNSGRVAANSSSDVQVRFERSAESYGSTDGELRFSYTGAEDGREQEVGLRVKAIVAQKLEFRFGSVDDRAFLFVNGNQVIETTGNTPWTVVPSRFLREGENEIEVKLYNAASRTGWPAQRREGWNFRLAFRIGEREWNLSDGVDEPPTEQWGTTFTVARRSFALKADGSILMSEGA